MTSPYITWHGMSQPTLPHLTPTHNQPHYFIPPRSRHNVPQHLTLRTPPADGTAEGWCTQVTLQCLGIALVGRLAHILWANSFFGSVYSFCCPLKLPPPAPARPGTTCRKTQKECKKCESLKSYSLLNPIEHPLAGQIYHFTDMTSGTSAKTPFIIWHGSHQRFCTIPHVTLKDIW